MNSDGGILSFAFRSLAATSLCLIVVGLAGCGSDSAPHGASGDDSTAADTPTSGPESDTAQQEDIDPAVVALEGRWELRPTEPHGFVTYNVDDAGNISNEVTELSPEEWKGTIAVSDDNAFSVTMATVDGSESLEYSLVDNGDSDNLIAFEADGSEFGSFSRAA
jgi:hypothetical protein